MAPAGSDIPEGMMPFTTAGGIVYRWKPLSFGILWMAVAMAMLMPGLGHGLT